MAPTQKKRKGKGHAGASSSSMDDEETRSYNAQVAENYEFLLNKSMPRERGFDMEHARRPLIVQLMDRHWKNFMKPPTEAVIPVVREFYANLRVNHDNSEVMIREKRVCFDSFSINRLYHLPDLQDDEYTAFKQAPVEFDEIIEYLCYPEAVWKLNAHGQVMTFQARYLKQAAAAVFLFIIARMMPAKHATDVTKDRAILIYCILKGHSIDVGSLISTSILHAGITKRNVSLPHSSLITELCKRARVEWGKDEEVLKLQVPIKVPTRQVMENDDLPNARAPGTSFQQAEEPRPPRTINQRMDALEHKVDNLYLNTTNFMTYVVDFNTALAHRFTNPNQPHPPFPDALELQNEEDQPDEEDDDEDDEH